MSSEKRRRRSPRRNSRALNERLIKAVAEAELSIVELAQQLELPLSDLARWAGDPAQMKLLESLARLADIRAQMLISRYRANAAVQLIGIASAEQPDELSRKACVDLLNANLNVFVEHEEQDNDAPAGPPRVSPQKILDTLETLGRESA